MTDLIERAKEALEGSTPGPWRPAKSYRALVSDSPSGYDDAESVNAYGGHMVCESVQGHNRRLIAMSPDLARALIAAGEVAETHRAMLRMMDEALKGTGKGDMAITPDESLTLVDAWKRDAAFRAIVEGKA